MSSLASKVTACSLLLGGFAVTGDLGRLADRGSRLLNATTVPTGEHQPAHPHPATAPADRRPAAAPAAGRPAESGAAAPCGPATDARRLPESALEAVDLEVLRPGAKIVVWFGSPATAAEFDVVDPATGEVLDTRARRLRLDGAADRPRRVIRGGTVRVVPLAIAPGGRQPAPAELLGPVRALEVR